ncbi:hypothetical protein G5I_14365 [Acromyrmex echinatior]|uniref:Secreted protein n=1 Tax=Acromyrmex echinatior TaxID=103372 RepID=F4X7I6_ACREC|nr:hypothetical protein G5I_14365 [Acromyrmex echinatior]
MMIRIAMLWCHVLLGPPPPITADAAATAATPPQASVPPPPPRTPLEREQCWNSAARSLLWWSVSHGCNDATNASSSSKNFVVPSVTIGYRQSAVTRITLAGAKLELKRRFVHVGGECLHYFSANEKLKSHVMDCEKMNDSTIRLPSEHDRWLEFEDLSSGERSTPRLKVVYRQVLYI